MYKKKLLIFGGTGFLGFHTAKKALQKSFEVTSISKNKPLARRYLKGVKYYFCDVSKKKKIEKILNKRYDYIINYSGYVDHSNKKLTYLSHFVGCKNIVDVLINKNKFPKIFIQIGSSIENGKKKSPQIETPINKSKKILSVYGQSKYKASKYLLNKFKKFKFPLVILRPYLIYGPNQEPNRLIPHVIKNCLLNKEFKLSNCTQYRDFLYIDDYINILFKILKSNIGIGQIFNIGSGKPIQLKKIINLIKNNIKKGKPIFGEFKLRRDEILKMYANINKVKKYYKWKPKTAIKSGINKTIRSLVKEI